MCIRDRDGGAACHLDAGLDGVGDLIQIHVAGDVLAVGAHHTDEEIPIQVNVDLIRCV